MNRTDVCDEAEEVASEQPEACFAPVNGNYSSVIAGARSDLASLLSERRQLVPLFFDTFRDLKDWADGQRYLVEPLRGQLDSSHSMSKQPCDRKTWAQLRGVRVQHFPGSTKNIVRVRCKHNSYDQLWVRASWEYYREAFRSWHRLRDELPAELDLSTLNADHVVSKAVLQALNKPNAWVMLFPVEAHANQFFGSLLERKIAAGSLRMDVCDIQLLSIFKMFSTKMPRNETELDAALADVKPQLSGSLVDFCKMRRLLVQLMISEAASESS